jgi:NADP-reducing hydrogenase subunit HndC
MQEQDCPYRRMILVCLNERPEAEPSCGARRSKAVADAIKQAVNERGLKGEVRVTKTHCLGLCEHGPNVMVFPEGKLFSGVRVLDVPALVERFAKTEI